MSLIHIYLLVGLVVASATSESVATRRKSLERMKKLLEIELELENLAAETAPPITPIKVDNELDTVTTKSGNTTLATEPTSTLHNTTADVVPLARPTCSTTPIVSYLLGIGMQREGIRIGHTNNQCHPSSRMGDVESYQKGLAILDNVHIKNLQKTNNQKTVATPPINNIHEATKTEVVEPALAVQAETTMPNFDDMPFDKMDVNAVLELALELDASIPTSMIVTTPGTLSRATATSKASPTSSDSNPSQPAFTTSTASPPTTLTDTTLTDTSTTPLHIVETKQAKINRMKKAIRAARVKAKKNGILKSGDDVLPGSTTKPGSVDHTDKAIVNTPHAQQASIPQREPVAVAVAARTPSETVHTNDSTPVTAEPDGIKTNQTSAFTIALFGTITIVVVAITTKLIKVNYKSGSDKSASSSRRSIPLAVVGEEQSWSFSTSSSFAASLRPRQSRKCSESLPL